MAKIRLNGMHGIQTKNRVAGLSVAVSVAGILGLIGYGNYNQLQREKQEREDNYRANSQLAQEVEQAIAGTDGFISNKELQDFLDKLGVKQEPRSAARRVSLTPLFHLRDSIEVRAYENLDKTATRTTALGVVPNYKLNEYLNHVRSQGK